MSASAAPAPIAAPPTTRKGKFVYLFIAQVLTLVLFPYLDQPGWPLVLFRVLGLAFFLSAIYALGTRRTTRIVGLALALPASC